MSFSASLIAVALAAIVPPPAATGETVTYYHAPGGLCLPEDASGSCADYTIVLGPDGHGTFARKRGGQDARVAFVASPAQMAAFARKLRPYRAHGEVQLMGGRLCKTFVTEGETIDIRWQAANSTVDHLAYNAGCGFPDSARMFAALLAAPALLPIADRLPRR